MDIVTDGKMNIETIIDCYTSQDSLSDINEKVQERVKRGWFPYLITGDRVNGIIVLYVKI